MVRVDGQCLLKTGNGIIQFALMLVNGTQVGKGIGVIGRSRKACWNSVAACSSLPWA